MTDNTYKLKTLNQLLKISIKRQKAFNIAASCMRDAQVKSLLNFKANEVRLGLIDLQNLINSFNGTRVYSLDVTGLLSRFRINIRNAILGYNRLAIINDIERNEYNSVNEYSKIASLYLPPKVRVLVLRLNREAQKNYDEIKAIRQSINLIVS